VTIAAGRTHVVRPAVPLTGFRDSAILVHCLAPDVPADERPTFRGIDEVRVFRLEVPARSSAFLACILAAVAAIGWPPADHLAGDTGGVTMPVCAPIAGPDPFVVRLVPTANANGASGTVDMRFADSPFGVAVTPDGHHAYAADIRTRGLRPAGSALVVWAATPSLDQVTRMGALADDGSLSGTIAYNKFLVFVTAEASADVDRWSGPILLRGASPSARMHTMAGHGPFSTESCRDWGFGPGTPESSPR
jgi:hypothetical protein